MTRAAPSAWRVARHALLVVVALVVVALATQALWLAPLVNYQATKRSGREAHVDSVWIGLSSSLAPVVHFRGIRIANAPWADSDRPFAVLESATATFSWTSIEQHRPVIALWVLSGGEIDLERTADGLRNWRLTNPEYRGPGKWKVLAVQGERATMRFAHAGIDLDLHAVASASGTPDRSTHLDIQGRWRKLPFAIDADTGPVLTFLETGKTFPVRGHVEAGGARMELEGALGDIVHEPLADAKVSIAASSLAPFSAFVGSRHREAKAVRVDASVKAGSGRYALSNLKARIGATDVAGDATWTLDEAQSILRAKLDSDSTDFADLRWLAGLTPVRLRAVVAEAGDASASAASSSRPASDAKGTSREPRELDAELTFAARRLHAAEVPALQSGRIEARLAGGRVTVSSFDVGIAQGHVSGSGALALHDVPRRVEADVDVRGVRIESFLRDAEGKSRLTGALQGHAIVKADGDSADALRDSASGHVTASLSGGTISSLLDAEIGLQVGKMVRSFVGGSEPIAIRCAAAALDVERGTGRLRSLVLDTERTRTTGSGTIDLAAETVDVVLTPQAKQSGLFNLERSIRLHGPMKKPARELIARAPVSAAPANGACARP